MIRLGLIGLGTVGKGVAKILASQAEQIKSRVGESIEIRAFCNRTRRDIPELKLSARDVVSDYKAVLRDPEIDVVVELIGGYEPARSLILEALKAGKHVVTANKAVLAKHWDEIFSLAQKEKRLVYFEAAVGGGVPVVQGLNEGLAANRIQKITGILNGTTNFILSRMAEGMSFAEALKLAQSAGFAEADPTFDIEGIDSAHKIAILASIAFGGWVKISDVLAEGITKIDLFDVELARREFGMGLKLLGIAKEKSGKVAVRVHPAFLPKGHPFSTVQNEYNAIAIEGHAVGDVMFYGKGAGQLAAASSVVSDIIFLSRHVAEGTAGKLPYVTYDARQKVALCAPQNYESRYYLRFMTQDKPGVLATIAGILAQHHVSIASVYQPELQPVKSQVAIVILTHQALEGALQKALAKIQKLSCIKAKPVLIRIEE